MSAQARTHYRRAHQFRDAAMAQDDDALARQHEARHEILGNEADHSHDGDRIIWRDDEGVEPQ